MRSLQSFLPPYFHRPKRLPPSASQTTRPNPLPAIIVVLLLLTAVQCDKKSFVQPDNPYGLPNIGTFGMGCLINGKPWISTLDNLNGRFRSDSDVEVSGMPNGQYYSNLLVGVKIDAAQPKGSPVPVDTINNYILYLADSTCQGFARFGVSSFALQGTVTLLNYDRTNNTVTGTFEGVIPIPNCDTLIITEGRFMTDF